VAALVKCRSCNKLFRMLTTDKGAKMPVDPDPTGSAVGIARLGTGNCVVLPGDRVHVLKKDEPYDGQLYTSHFATCEDSRRWWNKGSLRKAVDQVLAKAREGLD
jgi:hypothetical protein